MKFILFCLKFNATGKQFYVLECERVARQVISNRDQNDLMKR